MKALIIKYLSHGIHKTGGLVYENQFAVHLSEQLTRAGIENTLVRIHKNRLYKGLMNFALFFSGFRANGDINIVVYRLALTAMLKNLFTKRQVITIIHNYDPSDYKSFLLRIYSYKFFLFTRIFHPSNFAIVTVAPYWHEFFSKKFKRTKVFLIPNLFDCKAYENYRLVEKKKKIHLGQFSPKNDPAIFNLAEKLTAIGYECYFTTLRSSESKVTNSFSVKFSSFEAYLHDMAESEYTLALTNIKEGWNRIAHESLMVNTPVIGYAKGGLGNLLFGSGSIRVTSVEEAYQVIIQKAQKNSLNKDFVFYFDHSHRDRYFRPLISSFRSETGSGSILVSVVMPVFNASQWLPDAIESILSQSYTEFEFIIVNDGSTDHSEEIILSYDDQRIRYISLNTNYGNAYARNIGMKTAKGKYVMIQDSDDMSLPDRMKTQVDYMEKHSWVGVCGSYMKVLDGNKEFIRKYPTDPDIIRAVLFSKNPVAQPTVMLRREIFEVYNLHHLKYFEDFNLWYQASRITAIANIPKVLVHYRLFDTEQKLHHRMIKQHVVQLIFSKKLDELKIKIPEEEITDFAKFMKGYAAIDNKKYLLYRKWLREIKVANSKLGIYPPLAFDTCILFDQLRLFKFLWMCSKKDAVKYLPGYAFKVIVRFNSFRHIKQFLS